MVATIQIDDKPQYMRVRVYKMMPDGIDTKVIPLTECDDAFTDGWRGTWVDFKNPDELGATVEERANSEQAINNLCRDWSMQLNAHLLKGKLGKRNLIDLHRRSISEETRKEYGIRALNPKSSLAILKRRFEADMRKAGCWMGDED